METTDVVTTLVETVDFTPITNAMASVGTKAVPAVILGASIWVVVKMIKKAINKIG